MLARNDDYFSLFFRLLEVGGDVADAVWTLLMRLPTNPNILDALKSLEAVKTPTPNWDELLDSKCVLRVALWLCVRAWRRG